MFHHFFIIMSIVSLSIYFLPTIVGSFRGHENIGTIFLVNLLLGWSGIGWIGALVYAFL